MKKQNTRLRDWSREAGISLKGAESQAISAFVQTICRRDVSILRSLGQKRAEIACYFSLLLFMQRQAINGTNQSAARNGGKLFLIGIQSNRIWAFHRTPRNQESRILHS
jgi:hypothetical protein